MRMRGCLRISDRIAAALALALAAGCSPRVLVVVGTDPCADGGTVGCVPPSLLKDLVGYWRLDETAGGTVALDQSGYRNNGTLGDLDPATAWIAGRAGGGLAVDAAGFVNVEPSLSIDSITDHVTIAGWVFLEGTVMDYGTAASRQTRDTIDQHYHISINSQDQPNLFLQTDVEIVRLSRPLPTPPATPPPTRMTWVHIAGTYDGSVARLYIDGQPATSQPMTGRFMPDTTPFLLGANGNGVAGAAPTERFPGRIDEIMLYRRALGADEITQLYDGVLFPPRSSDAAVGN
jgi:large repetitive protein